MLILCWIISCCVCVLSCRLQKGINHYNLTLHKTHKNLSYNTPPPIPRKNKILFSDWPILTTNLSTVYYMHSDWLKFYLINKTGKSGYYKSTTLLTKATQDLTTTNTWTVLYILDVTCDLENMTFCREHSIEKENLESESRKTERHVFDCFRLMTV